MACGMAPCGRSTWIPTFQRCYLTLSPLQLAWKIPLEHFCNVVQHVEAFIVAPSRIQLIVQEAICGLNGRSVVTVLQACGTLQTLHFLHGLLHTMLDDWLPQHLALSTWQ